MNPRKLMGRLEAAVIRYNVGRGGIPELTNEDIAAALAMVNDPLARDIFTAIWWPAAAKVSRKALLEQLRNALMGEFVKRAREYEIAKLEQHIVECEWHAKESTTAEDRRERTRANEAARTASANRWPGEMSLYPRIAELVIQEIQRGDQCTHCGGRGITYHAMKVVACPRCDGRGVKPMSDRSRAQALGRQLKSYTVAWRPVYEWLHKLVATAEASAAHDIVHALRRDDAA